MPFVTHLHFAAPQPPLCQKEFMPVLILYR
jgi:hypothetical protein